MEKCNELMPDIQRYENEFLNDDTIESVSRVHWKILKYSQCNIPRNLMVY